MIFTRQEIVKWHDTDLNRRMRPSQMLMYLQECANHQLEAAGVSLDRLRDERGLAFLLSSISMRIYAPLTTGDRIDVQTWVAPSRGLRFNRGFRILHEGRTVVEASSVWGLMDLHARKLVHAENAPYELEPEPLPVLDLPSRLPPMHADGMERAGERTIVYSDADYNGHMNNTHYPDLFCDFTPDIARVRVSGLMLSFLREATLGHTLTVLRAPAENGYLFRTCDADGGVCTDARIFTEPIDEKNA